MEIKELYNIAKQYADMIRQDKPEFVSDAESAVCVIVDGNDQLVTGITSVTVKGGQVELIPAETVAVRRFIDGGTGAARQIVTMMFKDSKVVGTGKASLMILAQADPANGDCRVTISEEEDVALKELVDVPEMAAEAPAEEQPAETAQEETAAEEVSMEDLMDGFDVDTSAPAEEVKPAEQPAAAAAETESVGEPAEFADGFSIDESNPFFEDTTTAADSEVKTIDSGVKSMFDQPEDAARQGAAGFQPPPMMQGYPRQGMGYPQQGMQSGYPQQGMAYPQQGMQSGYPQQGMGYPQQGMQSGYPQQGMAYPQQGMGYPQQGMGYPQQGMGYPQQGMGYPQQGAGVPAGYPNGAAPYQQPAGLPSVNIPDAAQSGAPTSVSGNSGSLGEDKLAKSAVSSAADVDDEEEEEAPMTIEEMRKAAKQKKKNAKINSNFKKKMRDNGF